MAPSRPSRSAPKRGGAEPAPAPALEPAPAPAPAPAPEPAPEPEHEEPEAPEQAGDAGDAGDAEGGGEKAKAKPKPKKKAPKKKGVRFASSDAVPVREAAAEGELAARPRISSARMSRYEFTNVISGRAEMLARGAVPFIPLPPDFKIKTNMELREVALRELELGRIPFKIRREMPDGAIEEWKLDEMDIPKRYIETARMYDVKLE